MQPTAGSHGNEEVRFVKDETAGRANRWTTRSADALVAPFGATKALGTSAAERAGRDVELGERQVRRGDEVQHVGQIVRSNVAAAQGR
jgi:hypothetical protein